jgi:ribonuclease HI
MEIMAAFEAVKSHQGPVEIVSDSTYVVHCFRDLWEPFIDLVLSRGDVTFRWVKGHSGDPMNDLVDRLAVEAATTQMQASGSKPPTDLGPPDTFGTGESAKGIVDSSRAYPDDEQLSLF